MSMLSEQVKLSWKDVPTESQDCRNNHEYLCMTLTALAEIQEYRHIKKRA